jgi:hypothetical protein
MRIKQNPSQCAVGHLSHLSHSMSLGSRISRPARTPGIDPTFRRFPQSESPETLR